MKILKQTQIKFVLPVISVFAAILPAVCLADSSLHPKAAHPYFTYFLAAFLLIYLLCAAVGIKKKELLKKVIYKAPFLAGVILFLNLLNLATVKFSLLPTLYFPSLDRIFGTLVEDRAFLAKCVLYSSKILFSGTLLGAAVGIFTGIGIGFNKYLNYWLMPIIRVLGPIPSTAWIPIVLITFPTAKMASAFLIGVAVWFPTTVMTSSGISNVKNSYFEVSATLGANSFYRIFRVGVPAAMPHIFLGLFNGTCSSFITLMTAEMIGAKYGIGWYVNWQKEMMAYANVYAGLIVIAVLFSVLITLLFKVRDHILVWQKGVIKW